MSKEEKFFNTLREIFIGAKVEGVGGFINLMKIKSKYYEKIEQLIKEDIDKATEKYPAFKEELFDKLYTFFKKYFTESGSIYFNSTPFHNNVYEKVYTDDKDVILFWKTRMLYYVKTDRIFRSMPVEFDDKKFYFDASQIELKKANEKKELIYELKEIKEDRTIHLTVVYSTKGRKTKTDSILKQIKKTRPDINIKEEDIQRAIRIFERQSEVDYFINKNAREFLREQFNLWLYQYVTDPEIEWSLERIEQIQILKKIAYKLIDFVSQFEDELVKIWNKPKFVKNSNYVITLDRIASKNGWDIIEKLPKQKGWKKQVEEWIELKILEKEPDSLIEEKTVEKRLNEKYRFLPIDTKYFKDLEIEILELFDNLDEELDGWLIKSENYQALNTILPKFKGKVQVIYIDPPFNKENEADYFYNVKYKDSTWITMLENRLRLAKEFLKETGSIFVRCDHNGNWLLRGLMNEIFGKENFRNEIIIGRKRQAIGTSNKLEVENEYILFYSKCDSFLFKPFYVKKNSQDLKWTGFLKQGERNPPERIFIGKKLYPPKGQHFSLIQEKVDKLVREHYLRLRCKSCGSVYYFEEDNSKDEFVKKISLNDFKYKDLVNVKNVFGVNQIDKCLNCLSDNWKVEYMPFELRKVGNNWLDIPSYSDSQGFPTENSEHLLKRIIEIASNEKQLVLEFFLGSGTTVAVAQKLNRKWIGIELGEHFYTIVLPRMKKVLYNSKKDMNKTNNKSKTTDFFKYYELEQYEETLSKTVYKDSDFSETTEIGNDGYYEHYIFLNDEKMLNSLEVNYEDNNIKVDLDKLYPNIDIAEVLSIRLAKSIKKIKKDTVIFDDGSIVDIKNLDYRMIKDLIFWS